MSAPNSKDDHPTTGGADENDHPNSKDDHPTTGGADENDHPNSKDDHPMIGNDDENDHCGCEHSWDFDEWCDSDEEESGDEVDMPPNTFDQNFTKMLLAKMIVVDGMPLSIFQDKFFEGVLTSLNPHFQPVSRQEGRDEILRIYDAERTKTMKLLRNLRSRIAITTDVWICDNQYNKFLAVTAHFIDDSWILQSRMMRFKYMEFPECEEEYVDDLVKCFQDWNIACKLSTMTVDSCIKDDVMVQTLSDKISRTSLVLGGKIFRFRCFAHVLNSIVKDWFEVLDESIDRIRDGVSYWTATKQRMKNFEKTARQLNISGGKKFVLDYKNEWNTTYLMLTAALPYKSVFRHLEEIESDYKCYMKLPEERDWELVNEMCERLKLFYEATEMFSGSKYATTNHFFPTLCGIKLSMSKCVTSKHNEIQTMEANMITKFEKYWNETYEVMVVATVLDPRFKMKYFEYIFPEIHRDDSSREIERVRGICYELMKEYQSKSRLHNETDFLSSFFQSGLVHSGKEAEPLSNFDLFVSDTATSSTEDAKSELDYYLKEKLLPRIRDFSILTWWKEHDIKYPTLCAIARDFLAIPVSAIASEFAFTFTGKFLDARRSKLPKTSEAMMCAGDWLRAGKQGSCSTKYAPCCSSHKNEEEEEEEEEDEDTDEDEDEDKEL